MTVPPHPHVLGVDDGAFDKWTDAAVPIVGVTMEGADVVEHVALTSLDVDAADATTRLAEWIGGLRVTPSLHAVVLGGLTIAGLGVIDVVELAARLRVPVILVRRRDPAASTLVDALRTAGYEDRVVMVSRAPASRRVEPGCHVAAQGMSIDDAALIVGATRAKSTLPEPLRLAHLIATAVARGESHGRA